MSRRQSPAVEIYMAFPRAMFSYHRAFDDVAALAKISTGAHSTPVVLP